MGSRPFAYSGLLYNGGLMKVICGNCENIFDEEELELFRDGSGWFKGCPYCETDGYLKDLEEPMEDE